MKALSGALLWIATLYLGPAHAHDGWGALAGLMIGAGAILMLAELFGEAD